MPIAQHHLHIPLDVIQTPKSGKCVVDHYWMVHPEKGVLYVLNEHEIAYDPDSVKPVHNANAEIAKRFLQKDHVVEKVHIAYLANATKPAEEFRNDILNEMSRRRRAG